MSNTDANRPNSPELRRFSDSERIAEGKRRGIQFAAYTARGSLFTLYPELWTEVQQQEVAGNAATEQAAQIVDNAPGAAMIEAEMKLLDAKQEQKVAAELADTSRTMITDAHPLSAQDVQIESVPSVVTDARAAVTAAQVDPAIMGDVNRYLENVGSMN